MKKLIKLLLRSLPFSFSKFVGFLFGLFVNRKSYSQHGEDLIINEYFDKIGIKKGVYVDIGGFHPTWLSNTHILHKRGWSGHVLDIDSDKIASFRFLRGKRCRAVLGAVTVSNAHKKYINVYKFKMLWSQIDTIDPVRALEIERAIGAKIFVSQVPSLNVNDYLESAGKINLISIDIEGLDEEVLTNLNLEKLQPECVVWEDSKNWGGSAKVRHFLERLGYDRLFISGGSIGYAKPYQTT